MPLVPLDYAPAREFDTGYFTARYLQTLGVISILWMIVGPFFTHSFDLDLSFILSFWAASGLRRRSPIARKWTIAFCGLVLAVLVIFIGFILFTFGKDLSRFHLNFFGRIENPTVLQMLGVSAVMAILAGIPLAVLLSPRARRQFSAPKPG
jgi:hypothetical protein